MSQDTKRKNKIYLLLAFLLLLIVLVGLFIYIEYDLNSEFSINGDQSSKNIEIEVDELPYKVNIEGVFDTRLKNKWFILSSSKDTLKHYKDIGDFEYSFDKTGMYTVELYTSSPQSEKANTTSKNVILSFSDNYQTLIKQKIESSISILIDDKENIEAKNQLSTLLESGYSFEYDEKKLQNIDQFLRGINNKKFNYQNLSISGLDLNNIGEVTFYELFLEKKRIKEKIDSPPIIEKSNTDEENSRITPNGVNPDDIKSEKPTDISVVAGFSVPTKNIKVGKAVTFNNDSQNAISYEWDFDNDGIIDSSEASPKHIFKKPGQYTIKLTAIDNNGKKISSTQDIEVRSSLASKFKSNTSKHFIDQPISFENNSSEEAETFFWDFGDGQTSSEKNPTHQYDEVKLYAVTLKVKDKYGNEKTKKEMIQVKIPIHDLAGFFSAIARRGDNAGIPELKELARIAQRNILQHCQNDNIPIISVDKKTGIIGGYGTNGLKLKDFFEELYLKKNTPESKIGKISISKVEYNSTTGKINKIKINEIF